MANDIQQQQYFEMLARTNLNEAQVDGAKTLLDQINGLMTEYRTAKSHIKDDDRLSKAGKQADLSGLSQSTFENLHRTVDSEIKSLDKRVAELDLSLRPQNPDSDQVIELLKEQEIRAQLRDKSELDLLGLYQDFAVSGQNDLIMRSIENAPIPLITDPEILDAGKRARAERHDPKSATLLTQMRQWRAVIEGSLNTAKAELGITDNPIYRIAETGELASG